jgi:tetratricopeptide (TPR) repeat protein
MKMFVRILTLLFLGVFLPGGKSLHAQADAHYNAAVAFVQSGQIDSAKKEIDLLMADPASRNDAGNWYLYGFIYKELYKKYERTDFYSKFRVLSLTAFETSIKLDTVGQFETVSRDNLRFIAMTFFNDAVTTLDTVRYATSIVCYENYRKAAVLADTTLDINKKDIEYYLALATTYNTIYNLDKKKNAIFFDKTRDAYMKVLSIDPNNYKANYCLSVLYWNKGVDVMYDIDYDDSLGAVFDVQDKSVELFKQSLPFATKAYEIEPKREETLVVLSGIYYSLNEFEKSKEYQKMLEDLKKQK